MASSMAALITVLYLASSKSPSAKSRCSSVRRLITRGVKALERALNQYKQEALKQETEYLLK